MAVNTINFRLQDSETDVKRATLPVYVPNNRTLAEYQSFATGFCAFLDAVTGAKIVGIDMVLALTLVGATIKAVPVAGSLNERGGIVGMDTSGQFNDSFRIPAILPSIMSGDSFSLAAPGIPALINSFVTGDGIVIPKNRDGFDWLTPGLYGVKSFRRK